ncbi:YCF48-related protein [Ulvibacter antarcticus]|uniref:Putative secreted protein (Por secretion system target) n=1 Tax=Ulvibacter antarcticus TaxID=442714 RepID=A0A3L9YEE3_9FLAO|nr:YCF48-related protein [Ulvibacter antarcticus]RMA58744.1 putative secreted protein (Por secretion system target) [Ulvibacter antarcticus]
MKKTTFSLKTFILSIAIGFGALMTSEAQTFEYKDTGTDFILFDLSIPPGSNNIAYAATSKFTFDTEGTILKTVDAGETWQVIYPTSGTGPSFEKIEFITDDIGFAVGYDLILKTIDGGTTWSEITVGADVYLYNNLSFYNENIGLVSAQLNNSPYFAIYLTTDGGATWTAATDVLNAGGIEIAYADQNTLFSVGADEVISKSTDIGDTWTQIYSGIFQNYFVSTSFKDQDNGLVAGEDGLIKTTHDSGTTWSDFSTGYHHFFALAYKGDQLLAGGTDEDIYFSEDNGASWDMLFDGPGFNQLYEIGFFADGSGLICGSGGKMIKFSDVFLGTSENSMLDNQLISFYDSNSETFTVQSNTENIENINIYAMTGQLVETFKNDSNTFNMNASEYSKGIYLVTVTTKNRTSSLKFLKQ